MQDLWRLPKKVRLGEQDWDIRADFRVMLRVMAVLERKDLPESGRIYLAMRLFFKEFSQMPPALWESAAKELMLFLAGGREDPGPAGPRLLDWQQDAELIIADVNKAAGRELRELDFVHWWTFLSFFGAVGEGRLSAVVGIRKKLAEGTALDEWEKEYLRREPGRIKLRAALSPEEEAEKARLQKLLDKKEGQRNGTT